MAPALTLDEILNRLLAMISEITVVPVEQVRPDASLAANNVSSMGFVELLLGVERLWGVKLMDVGLAREDVASVNALAGRLHRLVGA